MLTSQVIVVIPTFYFIVSSVVVDVEAKLEASFASDGAQGARNVSSQKYQKRHVLVSSANLSNDYQALKNTNVAVVQKKPCLNHQNNMCGGYKKRKYPSAKKLCKKREMRCMKRISSQCRRRSSCSRRKNKVCKKRFIYCYLDNNYRPDRIQSSSGGFKRKKNRRTAKKRNRQDKKRKNEECSHTSDCAPGLCCAKHGHKNFCKPKIKEGQICTRHFHHKRTSSKFERCPCMHGLSCEQISGARHYTCQYTT